MTAWTRLIRFVAENGKIYHGEPLVDSEAFDIGEEFLKGTAISAKIIQGDVFENPEITDEIVQIKKLLGPLGAEDVPIVQCVGLNYAQHIKEFGQDIPPFPTIFYKSRCTVADFGEAIPIPKEAQENQCDYEGELCVVIGTTGKNIKEEEAFNHIAGFVCGNDISARTWQSDPRYAGSSPQWCYSKSFDRYAPFGPAIVSKSLIEAPINLGLKTTVNGEIRQYSNTNDLLFKIPYIVSFLSKGRTLERGTVIMTGTPKGVGMGTNPPRFLQDGDVVRIHIEKLGTLVHSIRYE